MKKNKVNRGEKAFEDYYASLYGQRWPGLKKSLLGEQDYLTWWNREIFQQGPPGTSPDKIWPHLLQIEDQELVKNSHLYYLDRASVLPVEALDISPGEDVLDMCAAPGGKTLGLALKLQGKGTLLSNDKSIQRRSRLTHVIKDFLTPEQSAIIEVKGFDAGQFGLRSPEAFDKILLDAPCSSERHLIKDPTKLEDWGVSRTKRLSKTQGTLLASAFDALRPGGILVYSTCSLSDAENDGLGSWLLKKREGLFEFKQRTWPIGEPTRFGHIVLPDQGQGAGPLFFMIVHKLD